MLLTILMKLNNVDVLYSVIGVNKKLDQLARDITFTRSIDLVKILSNKKSKSKTKSILDRFCFDIIPRIQHNIESLTLDRLSIGRVLCIGNYLKLWKLTLVNLPLKMACHIFNDESSFIHMFKHQILHLIIKTNHIKFSKKKHVATNVFANIFTIFTNLNHFEFGFEDHFEYSPVSLINLSSTIFYSTSINYLNVTVQYFNDCLCLFDGRFNQLHTVIVKVEIIENSSQIINNKKIVSNLKCFSLFSPDETIEYDSQIVPLLQQMSQLEKLTLSLDVINRTSFIDGTQLYNDILKNMSHLQSFIFDIVTACFQLKAELLPSCNDIRRTFIQSGYHMDCYIDYYKSEEGRCHIYSLPFNMEHMHSITNNFPGGLFMNVRRLFVTDSLHPFEHYFFARISLSFPLLISLEISNRHSQKKKFIHQPSELDKTSFIIIYPHLVELSFFLGNIDYVKQFLLDSNMRLPRLNKLHVNYDELKCVTNNFTNAAAHAKCAKLKHITFDTTETTLVYSKNFFLYCSSLEKYGTRNIFLT
ncbi:unnamed protein product [Rotaria sp. Silwood1]|nr:unnamed protein product [Rotaria sp. Silwood1]CAF1635360.1 unnamed protein product [Rotaria sp. Silwood1]